MNEKDNGAGFCGDNVTQVNYYRDINFLFESTNNLVMKTKTV